MLNQIVLVGRLVKTPELKQTETGKKATKRQKTGKYTRGNKRAEKSAFCGENKLIKKSCNFANYGTLRKTAKN